ncbi:hypothetical protein Ga0080574_TMP891 [Salipiger abyssi]|uniref:Uncharacterized protein n=1 Tax=Salipiger abyssi TaxID=1250539 RepID=A0A1P8UPC9_9RHOB|nr:hypothetical protein Ga0080574_TMP891 [Salipiger abyssi]
MTPRDLGNFIIGWNEAQSDEVQAPTADEYAELVRKYG